VCLGLIKWLKKVFDINKNGVKAIVQEPYYDCPKWITKVEYKEYIELNRNTSKHDVDLFIVELLGYNGIDIKREPKETFEELCNEESVVIAGGILFFDENNKIFPSCCCGLESWREIFDGVIQENSPWMGHTPYPTFEFRDNKVRIWSDDYLGFYEENTPKDEMYFIEYERNDLIAKMRNIEIDLKEFASIPFYNRLSEMDTEIAKKVVDKFLVWFDVRLK
jgi:hypothetical protein